MWTLVNDDPSLPMMVADQTEYNDKVPRAGLGADLLKDLPGVRLPL